MTWLEEGLLRAVAGLPSFRHVIATWHAKSLDIASQIPSVAIIKHSSSGSLFVMEVLGFDVMIVFRNKSPVLEVKLMLRSPNY